MRIFLAALKYPQMDVQTQVYIQRKDKPFQVILG